MIYSFHSLFAKVREVSSHRVGGGIAVANRAKRVFVMVSLVVVLNQSGLAQASRSLSEIEPQVLPLNPKVEVHPAVSHGLIARGRTAKSAVKIPAESDLIYPIPSGSQSFSGMLLYRDPQGIHQESDPRQINRVLVRFLVDGKPVFERAFDPSTLPQEFGVALPTGKVLTIATRGEVPGDAVTLLDPVFSPDQQAVSSAFLVNAGEGFVNFTPEARQILLCTFYAGEDVRVEAHFGGAANQAEVSFQFAPEGGGQTASSTLAIPLQAGVIARGSGQWKVPEMRGPGTLHVQERVAGNLVYERSLRIAIIPRVDLANVGDSTFGVHMSSEGYAFAQDSFASLFGAKWGRIFLRWPIVEREQGHFDFSRADQLVDLYRAQNMRVLGVLGEDAPAWAGDPGPAGYLDAWTRYVRAAVAHFRGRIDHWDVFNEVDAKYYGKWVKTAPDSDIPILRAGLAAVHETDPASKTVCCSNGTVDVIGYYRRLFDAGLLGSIDIVSTHPYRKSAPEEKEGPNNYLGHLAMLRTLIAAKRGANSIWSTEANWIMGARGTPGVSNPDLDEHTHAAWVVRINLMSFGWGIPYFLHMPFFYGLHPQIFLDALSGYAQMTSWFSGASEPHLTEQQGVYVVTANKGGRVVGAVWDNDKGDIASLSGLAGASFFDFYGNRINLSPDHVEVPTSPIYFTASGGSSLAVRVVSQQPAPKWQSLAPVANWARNPRSNYSQEGSTLHVTSSPNLGESQLTSPAFQATGNSCYQAGFDLDQIRGTLSVIALEQGGERLFTTLIGSYPTRELHHSEIRFKTRSDKPVQIVLSGSNFIPMVTEFVISNVGLARCQ